MKILGLDTSTMMTTCAVMEDDRLLGEFSLSLDMSHSETLVPMIGELMSNLGMKVRDMDGFAVSTGPGSFTGLRIGLATAKAFAHVTRKPIVGVSSLEVLADNMYGHPVVVPMMDARRDRVFTAIYKMNTDEWEPLLKPDAIEVSSLIGIIDKSYEKVILVGDGAERYREELVEGLGEKAIFAPGSLNMSRAGSVCRLGMKRLLRGESDDMFSISPDYLRDSQAQRMLGKKRKP
ncbi:MAG: tRNA (adenosine(37)-N6)-threonylcarbamoyltransferase complex dimerization subunit type 1 TsaB [Bacillota bacterium]